MTNTNSKELMVKTGYVHRVWLALASALLAVLAFGVATADAARVANPGPVTFRFESGTLQIRDEVFDAASDDDPATATGTIAANGNVTISSFDFPDLPPIDGPLGEITVSINVLSSSGHVNPLTGVGSMSASIRIDIDGNGVGGSCRIEPINLNMSTTAAGGVPYNTSNGTLTVADHTFSIPGAQGCNTFPINVNNEINSQLGLPSPSGQNHAVLTARTIPILQKAIVPAFTTNPSSGVFPLNVSLDASSTFHTRPISSYQWDFDNNGTFDQTTGGPTTSTTYNSAGTKTIRLRVTDADGDSQETTRQVIVDTPRPDLTVTKSHTGSFVTGNTGSYSIDVTNTGTLAATDTISVTDTLPAGFNLSGSSGSGWNCGAQSGQQVTCTSDDDLAIGASASTLTLDVVANNPGTFVNTATVDVNGDVNASNDTAEDTTNVIQSGIDLALTKNLDPGDGDLLRGRRATYLLGVTNQGTLPATERVRIVDTLPDGVAFVSAAGGPTWTCSYVAPEVRCFTDEDVAAGEALEDVRIRVEVDADAPDEVVNEAVVTVDGESDASDNNASHAGAVSGFSADYALSKSHTGSFIAGEPGFFRLEVTNVGTATAGNDVTVVDQLPSGLTYNSATGDGWTCEATPNGQFVSCEHAGQIEAGDSLPTITLKVNVDTSAIPGVTNAAAVFSPDDFNVENNVDEDAVEVRAPVADLAITKTHEGNFVGGSQGTYTIKVSNTAGEAAPGPTTVTDTLPAGLTYVSATGDGWLCGHLTGTVTCTYGDGIPGGAEAPALSVIVLAERPAANTTLTNVASVANANDGNGANNTASDPTVIADPQAPTELVADPILLKIVLGDGKILQGPTGHLKSDGDPVPGKTIRFTNQDGSFICEAVTDSNGKARCLPGTNWLLKLRGNGHYRATFAGDDDFKPATDTADVIRIYNIGL